MKIKSLQIKNFKSIEDLVLVEPNPFSVFVGPNGAGKSNIFEALEFVRSLTSNNPSFVISRMWGGYENILKSNPFSFSMEFSEFISRIQFVNTNGDKKELLDEIDSEKFLSYNLFLKYPLAFLNYPSFKYDETNEYRLFFQNAYKIFLNNSRPFRPYQGIGGNLNLAENGSNLELMLKEVFRDLQKREELLEWLRILIPEFKDIEITKSELSGELSFVIYEKSTNKPFQKYLISDGTQNILALLTAVYQSDEPQFLCIEEPENGLHPYVIKALVDIFRQACKEKGHYIWLNTHSETLVRQLTIDEIIVVDKKEGATRVRQFQGEDIFGLQLDEAWLTNALGGGLP